MADLHCSKLLPIIKKKNYKVYHSRRTDATDMYPALKIKMRKTVALMTKWADAHCADGNLNLDRRALSCKHYIRTWENIISFEQTHTVTVVVYFTDRLN